MNILLTLFLLFLVILLLFSNLKYRNKFTNYDHSNSVIVKNYIAQLLKYIFERKQLDENIPVRFDYNYDSYDTSTTDYSLNNYNVKSTNPIFLYPGAGAATGTTTGTTNGTADTGTTVADKKNTGATTTAATTTTTTSTYNNNTCY